jgi:hypothetical protein
VLDAARIVAHHNLVLARFARVLPQAEIALAGPVPDPDAREHP